MENHRRIKQIAIRMKPTLEEGEEDEAGERLFVYGSSPDGLP